MPVYKGIDVSEFQGKIDWNAVRRDGITFAMLRCGYGRFDSQTDERFLANYDAATRAGVHVGAYLFSYAVTTEQALKEAQMCLRRIDGKRFDYPIAYDVETSAHRKLGANKLSAVVQTFCETLEAHGCYVSVYTNLSMLENCLSDDVRRRYDVWLAQWSSAPTYSGAFGMWQYSADGTIRGIRGKVDLDRAYKDYPAIMRKNGLNGFGSRSRSDDPTP